MVYASLPRRVLASLMITTTLAACSSGDLVPPGSIDSATQVGAITPTRNLPRQPASQQGYLAPSAPVSQATAVEYMGSSPSSSYPSSGRVGDAFTGDSGHYLRAPDQPIPMNNQPVQQTYQMQAAPPASQGRLPKIDSDEAMALQGRQPSAGQRAGQYPVANAAPMSIPDEGVNIDAELGFGPDESDVVGLAEEQDTDIAEGVGSQPVVDGIGTDNPRALSPRGQTASRGMAQPMADDRVVIPPKRQGAGIRGEYASGNMTWSDGSRVTPPGRAPSGDGMQQVAMIRPNNPAGAPMSDGPMSQRDQPWLRGVMPQSEVSCRAELRRLGVIFEDRPAIGSGASCGIAYPVKLSGLAGGSIDVKPGVTLNCPVTLAFAKWVKNELNPSARLRYLTSVQKIVPMGGYSCRRMNNSSQRYNPMSEHAKGNAIDIGQIVLRDGHAIDVRQKGFFSMREGGLLKAVRSDSCKYFNTVLGPGSNAEHWNHFHFDLRSRRGGKRYCG